MATTGNILGTGVSGLLAYQRALATTGHNVANVDTEGYSRQRVELTARAPQLVGTSYIGNGVQTASVERVYNNFLNTQVLNGTAADGRLQTYYQYASEIDNLLANPQTSLSAAVQSFFNAVQDVANDPSSLPARQVMLSEGEGLVQRFHDLDERLSAMEKGLNTQLGTVTGEINSLAQAIAKINNDITVATGMANGAPPNDLLDQRDVLIAKLAERVAVTVTDQDDGSKNVFIGNGQALVVGTQANSLEVARSVYGTDDLDIKLRAGGNAVSVTDALKGGVIGGLIDFRNQMLVPARNEIGRVAVAVTQTFNAQHNAGMNLYDTLGADFFAVSDPVVYAHGSNAGGGSVTATVADVGALTGADYLLRYDGSNYTLTNLSNNATQTLSGSSPFTAAGLTISVSGLSTGDRFLIRPTHGASDSIDQLVSDPRAVAAAAPIRTAAAAGNVGSATVSAGEVLDASDANLLNTVTIDFVDANNYQLNGAGPLIAYTGGAAIDVNGWRVRISGTPAGGDTFTVAKNTGGAGDNRNALLLAGLQTQGTLDGGSATFEDGYGQLVASMGTKTHQAEINQQAQSALLQQAKSARDASAGVNLDEEAANMLRFQQAYQASAQVIAVANSLFQTLLGAVGG